MRKASLLATALSLAGLVASAGGASAQSYGADLHNTMMPASGGMAGVSLARPQDSPSALFGNPATMAQFTGFTFTFGGGYAEPTLNVQHDGFVTGRVGGGPWGGKSETEPLVVPAVAALYDLRGMDLPATVGIGFTALSGAGSSFRHIPNSAGTTAEYLLLGLNAGVGFQVTEQLSLGPRSPWAWACSTRPWCRRCAPAPAPPTTTASAARSGPRMSCPPRPLSARTIRP